MKVTIKGQEYNFTFDSVWGPMYLYEEVAGEKMPFNPRKTACLHLLFYCILLRSNPGLDLTLEEFKSCSELIEKDIFDLITPKACVNVRKTDGGPASEKVKEQIKVLKEFVKKVK